jgi:hypothetical protein
MTESGRVSKSRQDLADMFDVDWRCISERIRRAVDAQLLDRVGGGYKGHPQILQAVIPAPQRVLKTRTLSSPKDAGFPHHKSAPYKRTYQPDGVRDYAPHDARVIYETRQSNGHKRDAGVEPDHAVTEEQELREGENPQAARRVATSPRAGDEVDALSEVRVACFSNVD